jgi:hypothetical protein
VIELGGTIGGMRWPYHSFFFFFFLGQ